MYRIIFLALLCIVFLCAEPAYAEVFLATVVSVQDGDTITVNCIDRGKLKVRLYSIDAPEKKQAFGKESRRHLSQMVARQVVTSESIGKDKYGRVLGWVYYNGSFNANMDMVESGMAWYWPKYCTMKQVCPVMAMRTEAARIERRGLWVDDGAVAPWDWR